MRLTHNSAESETPPRASTRGSPPGVSGKLLRCAPRRPTRFARLSKGSPGSMSSTLAQASVDGSLVAVPPSEMLWLAIAAASYVAETGDPSILAREIPSAEGISLSLREHCERAIRTCFNDERWTDNELLSRTIRLWAFATEDPTEFSAYLDALESRRRSEKSEFPETRSLPRRLGYLQSACPALSEAAVAAQLSISIDGCAESAVYSTVVERVLGLVATREGLALNPSLPESWPGCRITRRFRGDTVQYQHQAQHGPRRKRHIHSGRWRTRPGQHAPPLRRRTRVYGGCDHRLDTSAEKRVMSNEKGHFRGRGLVTRYFPTLPIDTRPGAM